MKICIKTMAGGNYPIEIDENAPLSALRQAIHEVLGTPVDMQRLIFQGHGLTDNERSLKNYGIKDGLVVHMVVRQANMPPPTPAAPATQHRSTTLTRGNAPAFLLPLEAHRGRSFGGSRPSSHTNLISGTLVISRSSIFEDVSQLTTLIERVVSSVVTPLGNSVAAHVQPQTSDSASSDLSYLITIRGNSDVVLDSGALERMAQLLDGVTRNEHALDILNVRIIILSQL
ncbi:hypothetical protein AB6A40_008034 [Gnathostoma spinigerum]|uniref:Ubiquitin-like domain-containing protein n=1 Tax=Gnathostoma spinigerum TaxID=75299 RepID=A0ABD6EP65_9BILA